MGVAIDAAELDLSKYVRAGDRIVWGQACGEPTTLVEALIAQAETIGRVSAFAATSLAFAVTSLASGSTGTRLR